MNVIPHELPGNIFMQPWWLDCVAPNSWQDIQIKKGGVLHARWPIVRNRKKGFLFIEMPVLTQKLGPWIRQTSSKQETIHSTERSMLEKLIKELPEYDKLNYKLSENITNYLPFKWNGFTQESATTFRFEKPLDTDLVWKSLKSSIRRHIRRAEESLSINQGVSVTELYDMISQTFRRQGLSPPYSQKLISALYQEASERGRADILGAVDGQGKLHAAHLFIHDDEVTYYLAGGFDNDSEIPGAVSYVLWNGIKEAHNRDNAFDFEGSSIESIERYFSSFGAVPLHFHKIQSVSNRFAPIFYGKELINKIRGR